MAKPSTYGSGWDIGGNSVPTNQTPRIGTSTAVGVEFITNDTARMTVSSSGDVTFSGAISAASGYRMQAALGSGALAASQTNTVTNYPGVGFVAQRNGSITALSGILAAAITGAGTTANFRVAVNGTPIAATAIIFTQAGGETKLYATFTAGTHTFVAGDEITVVYTSTAISNTPGFSCSVEVVQ